MKTDVLQDFQIISVPLRFSHLTDNMPIAQPSAWKKDFVNSDQNLPKSKYQSFVVLSF